MLTVIGGTLFVAFFAVGMTLWSAPLLSPDELTDAGAEAYLGFDDVGWVLLALSGISIGVMIIGVSLAALELGTVPRWAGWVSLALGRGFVRHARSHRHIRLDDLAGRRRLLPALRSRAAGTGLGGARGRLVHGGTSSRVRRGYTVT